MASQQSIYFVVYEETHNDKYRAHRTFLIGELEHRPSTLKKLSVAIQASNPRTLGELDAGQLRLYKPGAMDNKGQLNHERMLFDVSDIGETSFNIFHEDENKRPLIVIAPKAPPTQTAIYPVLMAMATANLDAWDRTSEAQTTTESESVRQTVLQFYGIRSRKYCQIAGANTKHVVNAHIWPQGSKANLVLLDLQPDEINNPQNILRLHRALERYFDHKQLTFVESGTDRYVLKVLDGSILSEKLKGSRLTVTDVDGRYLKFHNASRPWRRILALHSIMAHRHARKQGWVNDEDLTAAETNAQALANYSLDTEAQERLKLFLRERAVAEQTSSTSAPTIPS